jgi:predicted ribosomally synthesized peptide with nif11-like leader
MSEEQLKAFLEKVKGDTSLQEKLKAAADANAVAAIAKEAGFSISADDLSKVQSELSDEELEGVAGGRPCVPGNNRYVPPAQRNFWQFSSWS